MDVRSVWFSILYRFVLDMTQRLTRFTFLCLPGFPLAALSLAIESLRVAHEIQGGRRFEWQTVGETRDPVPSASGLKITPDCALSELNPADIIMVFAGAETRFEDKATAGVIRRTLVQGGKVAAISGSIFALAETGLLDRHTCSVHFCYSAAIREQFPDINCVETVFHEDRRRVTIAGSLAAFEYMLHIIADEISEKVSIETACWLQHPVLRSNEASQSQPGGGKSRTRDMLPAQVAKAIEVFSAHLETPVLIRDVAAEAGMSLRQFERVFRRELGVSPGGYYRKVRLKAARQKVIYTPATLGEIALSVGYGTSRALSVRYEEEFGVSPAQDRSRQSRIRGQY